MAVSVLRNRDPRNMEISALNPIRVVGSTNGDIAFVDISNYNRVGTLNDGIFVQAVSGSISVSYTLAPVKTATDPRSSVQSTVPWTSAGSLTSGQVLSNPIQGATALRLTFTARGEAAITSM
jgi:hypothetical protein